MACIHAYQIQWIGEAAAPSFSEDTFIPQLSDFNLIGSRICTLRDWAASPCSQKTAELVSNCWSKMSSCKKLIIYLPDESLIGYVISIWNWGYGAAYKKSFFIMLKQQQTKAEVRINIQ